MVDAAAAVVLLASLFCCGTWPAMLTYAAKDGRHAAHSYLDYTAGYVCVAFVTAVASPLGGGDVALAVVAMVGGAMLCVGNLCLQIAVDLGVPLTAALPLQASLTVVLGTSLNFALQPDRSDAAWLFAGVALFAAAIALTALIALPNAANSGVCSAYDIASAGALPVLMLSVSVRIPSFLTSS